MNEFKILFCEDVEIDKILVDAYIKNINTKHPEIKIELTISDFAQSFSNLASIYDLLILDMYKRNERIGEKVLEFIVNNNIELPVIIYTTGSKEKNPTNYNEIMKKYDFVSDVIVKGEKGEDLRIAIERYIYQQEQVIYFEPYDEDDIFLQADVKAIGKNNINEILYKIKSDLNFKDVFILERMSSGFSGAAVFKLKYNGLTSILKMSRDKLNLKQELENATKLYDQFPLQMKIKIESKEYSNNDVIAMLIEEVEDGLPLFKWLKNNLEKDSIDKLFENLFLIKGLKEHYVKRRDKKREKFDQIFKKFDAIRYSLVQKAINELKPIINHYKDFKFNDSEVKNLILNACYENLDKNKLIEDRYKKELVLCHGDFHSNNVIVQENRPFIIDTGGIGYDFWCTDICRLLVNIFILGFDEDSFQYYDLSEIRNYLEIVQKIINLELIKPDGTNDGFIYAINWLTSHVDDIYGDLYSKWEYQLGLMKEFLQTSYRINSIPPGKRAFALLAAYKCMILSNEEIQNLT